MKFLFLAHGSTDHEVSTPTIFLSAAALAEHVYSVAVAQQLSVSDMNDTQISTAYKPAAIAKITKRLMEGCSVFVDNDHRIELVATRQQISYDQSPPDTISLFCSCDHLSIDDQFVGFVENEAQELTGKYLAASSAGERQAILDTEGDTVVFQLLTDDSVIAITLREFAESELDVERRYAYVRTSGGNYRVTFLVSFAL